MFQLLNEHVPDGFLVADIKVTGQRHIVLATEKQLSLLNEAKQWYADGTFELIKEPFMQIYSIHAFIKKGGELLQIPLLFVLMTKRRYADYKAVSRMTKDNFVEWYIKILGLTLASNILN